MRTDSLAFAADNQAATKERRHVVRLSFDSANTIVWDFTSHTDTATAPGASVIANVIEGLSVTSQHIDPDKAVATIGEISFRVVDKSNQVTNLVGGELALGFGTRHQRVQLYEGHAGAVWADYTLIQTQIVDDITIDEGVYTFKCADIQRSLRKDIFVDVTTTLTASINDSVLSIPALTTTGFELLEHGISYSDAPGQSVVYIQLEDEIIRCSAISPSAFTVDTNGRGALNTLAVAHNVDTSVSTDRRTQIKQYVYFEMPAVKASYAIQTGNLLNQPGKTLPSGWHLGIDPAYVRQANFTGIGVDLYDPADDSRGVMVRFEGEKQGDGKRFIEEQLHLLLGCFAPVYNDGALGLRRLAPVLAGAAYVGHLTSSNVIDHGELQYDQKSLHNQIQIDWNWEPAQDRTTRTTLLIDANSIVIHGQSEPLKLELRGLHGSIHSDVVLKQRFDSLRDRYVGPPYRLTVRAHPKLNVHEVGDILRATLADVRDPVAGPNQTLDRSFEVQQVSGDPVNGDVSFTLFASTQAPGALAPTADATVLADAFYSSSGSALSSVLTITGSNPGHVSASGNLAGAADLTSSGAIYYYLGDLVIDAGVIPTFNNNTQIRVRGNLTINGKLDGKGRGFAGAAQIAGGAIPSPNVINVRDPLVRSHNEGTAGFIGSPKSGGGYVAFSDTVVGLQFDGWQTVGANSVMPEFALTYDGTTLRGLPGDLRGSSGSSGNATVGTAGRFINSGVFNVARGGAGGASGAGLCIIARGVSFGASGKIDTSGVDGLAGEEINVSGTHDHAGAGAGGAPGGCLIVLDGSLVSVPTLTGTFIADYGKTPITGIPLSSGAENVDRLRLNGTHNYPFYVGTGNGTTFPVPSLSGANGQGCRIKFAPANPAATADPAPAKLSPPSSVSLASGTSELLLNSDGTVVPRIKVTWSASTDPRTLGYEVQFKESSGSIWQSLAPVFGQLQAWASPVKDGIAYDVRVRAAGALRLISVWVTVTGHTVIGKTAPPANVTGFSASQNANVVVFQWNQVSDVDLAGYEIRYGPRATATWADGVPLTRVTRGTQVTSAAVPPGDWLMMIKARDTSGNYSTTEVSTALVVSNALDIIFQSQQAPDWPGNRVAKFNGSSDFAQVSYNSAFDFERTDAFSVIVRARVRPHLSGGFHILLEKMVPGTVCGYHLAINTGGALSAKIRNVPGNLLERDSTTLYEDSAWHTFGFTYAGTSNVSGLPLYVDGAVLASTTTTNALTASIVGNQPIIIGRRDASSGQANADIAEVWVYKRQLSAQDMADLHQGKAISAANLVGHWNFAEHNTVTVYDDSGNALHASLTGPTLSKSMEAFRYVQHWTGVLIPDQPSTVAALADFSWCDTWLSNPFTQSDYHAPEVDIGFDDTARIHGAIASALGPGETLGVADPDLEVDFRTAAGAYDGFEPWTIGDRVGRYFKLRIAQDNTKGKAKVTGFLPTVDQLERTESRKDVVIAPGGSVIAFLDPFHLAPNLVAVVVGTSALFVVASTITPTQATFNVYNTSGTSVGGTINYDATSV